MSDLATVAVELILTENLSSGAGTYSCSATNAADWVEDSQLFELLVFIFNRSHNFTIFLLVPANITEGPVSLNITKPGRASFNCTALGI